MKLPTPAPSLESAFDGQSPFEIQRVMETPAALEAEVSGTYMHWEDVRQRTPPSGLTSRQWWLGIKVARRTGRRLLPLLDKSQSPFSVALTDSMSRQLHFVDREAAGSILGLKRGEGQTERDTHLVRSLIEEAMTSSQLEGASTTRVIAKEMLRTGRPPRDRSESMIYNNFRAMQKIRQWYDEPLTVERILEIHRVICGDTLDDPSCAGRFRRADEPIRVYDHRDGTLLHEPPPAEELGVRMERLCVFANDRSSSTFLHPAIRAICLHFQIGYDHPFVDGNGRVARALFYWAMGSAGYWLTEFVSISSVLRKAPAQYARAYLWTEDDESDLGYFVDHQLRVFERAVDSFRGYMQKKLEEEQAARRLLKNGSRLASNLNHRQKQIVLDALKKPGRIYRIAEHQGIHQISYQTARSDLLDMVEKKLLQKTSVGRAFGFQAVANLMTKVKPGR